MRLQRFSKAESGIDEMRYLRHTYSGKFAGSLKLGRL